jgi:ABC-type uncharacterized transport system substrate-binding protein
MVKIKKLILLVLILTAAAVFPLCDTYAGRDVFRVAYLEGEPYVNYAGSLSGLVFGLSESGFTEPLDGSGFQEGSDDAEKIWHWLKDHSGDRIEFVQDEFYQLIFMSEEEKAELARHMNEDGAVDLILVMGTAAAKFVKENHIRTDMMVISVTNAYKSGIVSGIEYSGIDNIWAHISPDRYYNQLNVFYDLFRFKKLGIVYMNSETGRNEAAYEDIKRFAENKGVELVEVPVDADTAADGPELFEEKMIQGYHSLGGKADAVYMTNSNRTPERVPEYLAPLYERHIPVFSQTGRSDVENGATMTVVRYSFQEIGSFCADRLVGIMEGKRPGELEQAYDESQAICFNIAAAEQAGLKLPFRALLSADTIYTRIGD